MARTRCSSLARLLLDELKELDELSELKLEGMEELDVATELTELDVVTTELELDVVATELELDFEFPLPPHPVINSKTVDAIIPRITAVLVAVITFTFCIYLLTVSRMGYAGQSLSELKYINIFFTKLCICPLVHQKKICFVLLISLHFSGYYLFQNEDSGT